MYDQQVAGAIRLGAIKSDRYMRIAEAEEIIVGIDHAITGGGIHVGQFFGSRDERRIFDSVAIKITCQNWRLCIGNQYEALPELAMDHILRLLHLFCTGLRRWGLRLGIAGILLRE